MGTLLLYEFLLYEPAAAASDAGEAPTRTHWYPNTTREKSKIASSYCAEASSNGHVRRASSSYPAAPFATLAPMNAS